EFPGLFILGCDLPVDPEIAKVFQTVRASSGPARFGPGSEHSLPAEAAQRFTIQSMLAMAFYPKGAKPYTLGLYQCSYPRVWTSQEERLFQEKGMGWPEHGWGGFPASGLSRSLERAPAPSADGPLIGPHPSRRPDRISAAIRPSVRESDAAGDVRLRRR